MVAELDEHLRGARPGDIFRFTSSVGPESQSVSFQVLVKEVKELVLPEVTDEWAAEASEFVTVDELTADLRTRLRERHVARARFALEQRAVDALVELVTEEIPPQLVDEEFRERVHDLGHRLEAQGIGVADFVRATGQSEEEFLEGLREAALRSVKADLALRALADAESIEVTDEEVDEELAAMADASRWTSTRSGTDWNGRVACRRYARTDARRRRCDGSSTTSNWSGTTESRCRGRS